MGIASKVPEMDTCQWQRPLEPCLIVIFGASGDLTRRKLIPALYSLYLRDGLPERFGILGVARTRHSDESFRELVGDSLEQAPQPGNASGAPSRADFLGRLFYQPLDYADPTSYRALAERLAALDAAQGTLSGRLFNLALPPELYGTVASGLAAAGLADEEPGPGGWARLVVEKPFGRDLATARVLNDTLSAGFAEHQIFRIDHYLAKETVQNILCLRFANAVFEPIWNRNYIDHVRINASESLGVGHRAGYYDSSGVLRDMFQNHMMQLLALVAAEPPSRLSAERVRDKHAELFRSLRPLEPAELARNIVLGQYAAGEVSGEAVPGYLDEPGVAPDSCTPTYALLKVHVDNWRWQGVPFYLTSGKRLKRKVTRIDIQFKDVPYSLFRHSLDEEPQNNRLVLGIYPEEEIFLSFQAKRPGPRLCLRNEGLRFAYRGAGRHGPSLDAYAKALGDVLAGDQTLFWRQDQLELTWEFFQPVLEVCDLVSARGGNMHAYRAGSYGPRAALDLLPKGSWPEKP